MRQLPLFKFGSRARSASVGIALCTMFIVASFSIANGLQSSMDTLSSAFESEYYLITRSSDDGLEYFDEAELGDVSEHSALGIISSAHILPYDESVTVFSVTDEHSVLPAPLSQSSDTVLKSKLGYALGNVTLIGSSTVDLAISGSYSSSMFPSDWLLTSQNVAWALTTETGLFNYAIGKSLDSSDLASLRERGLSAQAMIGIIDFLGSGVQEVRYDMNWVLLPSAFVIAVLAYSFVGSEISDRRHEIGILKTVGAGRARVMSYLIGDALIISAWGGLLGVALGIVLSYAISTLASAMFTSVFVLRVDEVTVMVAYIATVVAGVLGALIPASMMTVSSPVEDLREAGR